MADTVEVEQVIKTDVEMEARIRKEFEEKYEVWKAKDLAELEADQEIKIQESVAKMVAEWKENQKPPSKEEIQKLLDQEYIDFNLVLQVPDPTEAEPSKIKKIPFVIRELPQDVEKQFYKMFRTRLKEHLPDLNALWQRTMDRPFEEKANAFMDAFEETFDVLAETVVMVLNPYKKVSWLDMAWVSANVSSIRQWNIVQAQIDANKLRDFFLKLSQSGQTIQTMTEPLSFQQLQQRVR